MSATIVSGNFIRAKNLETAIEQDAHASTPPCLP